MLSVKHLIECLNTDRDWGQRFEAQEQIKKYGLTEEQFQESLRLLSQSRDQQERYGAADILGLLKDKRAVPALCESLANDRDEFVRMRAARSLGHIPDERAIPVLRKALKQDNSFNVKSEAGKVLMEAAPQTLNSQEQIYCLLLNYKYQELEMLDNQILPVLLEALSEDIPKLKQLSLRMLRKMDGPRIEQVFLNFLVSSNPHLRHESAIGLGEKGGINAITALYLSLSDEEQDVKDRAAEALVKIIERNSQDNGILAHIPDFMEMLKADQSHLKECASKILVFIGAPAVPALIQSLSSPHWAMRMDVSNTIAKIGEPALPALISALKEGQHSDSVVKILSSMIMECNDITKLQVFEQWIAEAYEKQEKNGRRGKDGIQVAKLRNAIAKKKNELSEDKGILLNDIPRPPQGKKIFQQLRRATNG